MATISETGLRAITDHWRTKDIVYVSIVGAVMLAACLEWFLWLAAFFYCLVKVFQKAGNRSIRILAVILMFVFTGLRCIFLPIMIVTLPLPAQVTSYFPREAVSILQWFAFWAFSGLLTVPWLLCIFQLVTHSIGRNKRHDMVLDEQSAPKMVIIMPCYREVPEVLLRTVDSIVDCDYPQPCIHVFLSFDGDQEDELYLKTIEELGVTLMDRSYPKSCDTTYRGVRITISRFAHGGKRNCQKKTFQLIDRVYTDYIKRHDDLFLLFIDSDCILDKFCIRNFMYEMELDPRNKGNMLAMTGLITSTTEKNSLLTLLQDMEYIHGQLFERSVESGCGAVTCLPGALTVLRFSAFRKVAEFYFVDNAEGTQDLFDYGKSHLGEDRWLTHLFMVGAKKRYQIQMSNSALCKTEAVQTYGSLMKQRRRWFLGFITNEAAMLTDIRLWKRYPLLCVIRLAQNTIRTTALLFLIMVISLLTSSQRVAQLPVGFIAVSLGLNWALMLYFSAKLGRYKLILYPIMFVVNPFLNWAYMVYGIFTAGQRTWGGPRVDAGAQTDQKRSQSVAQEICEADDELEVIAETFNPSVPNQPHGYGHSHGHSQSQHHSHSHSHSHGHIRSHSHGHGHGRSILHGHSHILSHGLGHTVNQRDGNLPVHPSSDVEGRFVAAERMPGGWYKQEDLDSSGPSSESGKPNNIPRESTELQDMKPLSSQNYTQTPEFTDYSRNQEDFISRVHNSSSGHFHDSTSLTNEGPLERVDEEVSARSNLLSASRVPGAEVARGNDISSHSNPSGAPSTQISLDNMEVSPLVNYSLADSRSHEFSGHREPTAAGKTEKPRESTDIVDEASKKRRRLMRFRRDRK